MFAAIFATGGSRDSDLIVYGPFADEDNAWAWVGAQDFPNQFFVEPVYTPPPPVPPATSIIPDTFSAGQFVVCLQTFGLTAAMKMFVYGHWTTAALADAWIAGRPFPGGASVREVLTPS